MFGGVTTLNEDLNLNIYKEILLIVMGPLFQILFFIFLTILYNNNLISIITYDKIYNVNILLLSFNLLPIIPLDGGKLLNNILDLAFSYKTSHKISIIISFLSLPLLFLFDNKILIILLLIFLILNLIDEIKEHKYKLENLLLERKIKNYKFKKVIKISNINKVKRNKGFILDRV